MKPTFYYVDAPIGSGKTYALVQYAKTTSFPTTIGTQTNALTIQYEADLSAEWLSAKAIYRDEQSHTKEADDDSPESSAKRYKAGCKAGFPFLIVNQDVAGGCKNNTENRDLFNDEITPVYERVQIDGLPVFQEIVAAYFDPINKGASEFVRLRRSKKVLKLVEEGWKDKLLAKADQTIKKAFDRLGDADFDVFVNRKDLNDFSLSLRGWLSLHIVMRPHCHLRWRPWCSGIPTREDRMCCPEADRT